MIVSNFMIDNQMVGHPHLRVLLARVKEKMKRVGQKKFSVNSDENEANCAQHGRVASILTKQQKGGKGDEEGIYAIGGR